MRSVVYRFDDQSQFQRALGRDDQVLGLPPGETVKDGEWELAIFELGRGRNKRKQVAHLPILMLTGNAASKDVVLAFAAGADDYVTKPFRATELGARIFGLLRRSRRSFV